MASRWQVTMDFNSAKSKANELDRIAGDLKRLANTDLDGTMTDLSADWKGDNATAYIRKGQNLKEQIQDTVSSLERTADTIRAIAQNIYNAEMEAIRIAEERAAREAARRAEEEARRLAEAQAAAQSRARGGGGGGGGHR
ncbi:MAG: WXG100 family type VII secretion target [Lachnospiraceae bacterium]|nr:WXG100 family type VII secretion target [Lachnospiraceae bacterium]